METDELTSWFRSRGLAARMGYGSRPALLVVDMQLGFTDPRSALGAPADEAVAQVARLCAAARRASVPVIYTIAVFAPVAENWARKLPAQRELRPGSEWVRIDPRIGPSGDDLVIEKHFASAFFGTDLESELRSRHIDTLIVTGMTTSGCVRASVVDACSYGYRVAVPREAVADRAIEPHEASLFDLDAKYADVVSTSAILDYLQKSG